MLHLVKNTKIGQNWGTYSFILCIHQVFPTKRLSFTAQKSTIFKIWSIFMFLFLMNNQSIDCRIPCKTFESISCAIFKSVSYFYVARKLKILRKIRGTLFSNLATYTSANWMMKPFGTSTWAKLFFGDWQDFDDF